LALAGAFFSFLAGALALGADFFSISACSPCSSSSSSRTVSSRIGSGRKMRSQQRDAISELFGIPTT
jgi:hypothetical protein